MDLFQIMCSGGCGKEPEAIYFVLKNITKILKIGVIVLFLILIIIDIVKFLKIKKNRSVLDLGKKIVKKIILCFLIFFILTIIGAIINLIFVNPEYNDQLQCWCA